MSVLGLFLVVVTVACVVSAVRRGKTHKMVVGVALFPLGVLATIVGLALVARSERRLAYGRGPTLSGVIDRSLEALPFLQRVHRSWHGRGHTRAAIGRVLAVGVSLARARHDAEAEDLWKRHRERWREDAGYRFTYREQRREEA